MNDSQQTRTESEKTEVVKFVLNGMSDVEACQRFGIDKDQLNSWKIQYPGAQISLTERIRLIEIHMLEVSNRLTSLENSIKKLL